MKKINSLLTALLLTATVFLTQQASAQAPQKMSYQSVLRNSSNVLLANTAVGIKISVLQGSASGTPVYVETQTATTNANGLVSLQIGTGTATPATPSTPATSGTGTFAGINWAGGPYFIKSETDPAGGSNYTIIGTQEMMSVPYALYGENGEKPGTTAGQINYWNGTAWVYIEPILNNNVSLCMINEVPTWVALPGAPTIGTVTTGNGKATIAFTAPASNGGATITSYTATFFPGALTGTVYQAGSGAIIVTGLTNGTAYSFMVTATNAAGTSAASAVSNSITPRTVPGAPTIGTATLGNGQATISYTAPANNGGAAITSYTATSSPGGLTGTLPQAGSGTITVTGLTNGTAYTFTITAINAAGTSAASTASNSVTPYTIPNAPTIGIATAGAGLATITYTAPASNGGAAITSYTAITQGFQVILSQAGSGIITVRGLTVGQAYTFQVYATNAAGTSAGSAMSNWVTLTLPPEITICTQVWATKNLDVTTYSDGTVIPQVTDPTAWALLTTGAWCYYGNVTANGTTYGKLYNWYAVAGIYNATSLTNSALRKKLAPTGWHVPTNLEWETLTGCVGASTGGNALKESGLTHWYIPNEFATNSSYFTGLPGGHRNDSTYSTWEGITNGGYWWTSSESNGTNAYYRSMNSNNGVIFNGIIVKKDGHSVRCLRD